MWTNFRNWLSGNIGTVITRGLLVVGLIWLAFSVRSCSSSSIATGATAVSMGIWILLGGGLISAAVISRDRPYLAVIFGIMAAGIMLLLAGKLDSLWDSEKLIWLLLFSGLVVAAVFCRQQPNLAYVFVGLATLIIVIFLGTLPKLGRVDFVIAKASENIGYLALGMLVFYAYRKADGGLKSFLGLSMALLVIFWVWEFSKLSSSIKINTSAGLQILDKIGQWLSNPMAALLGTLIVCAAFFHYIKSTVMRFVLGIFFLILFIMLIGPENFTNWTNRWPRQIPTPASVGQGIGNTAKDIGGYIPKPSGHQSRQPSAPRWVEFAKLDFYKISCNGMLKNPIGRLELPRGYYLFSHTVQARFGKGEWTVQTTPELTKNYFGEDAVFIKPPGGDINAIVTVYKKD